MRLMGLDYGDKTVGVALSDETALIAFGLEVIEREREESIKKTVARLSEIIKEFEVSEIVLGYPVSLNNTLSLRCEKTLAFKDRLLRNFKKIPVTLYDERLTTNYAERSLSMAGLNKKKQGQVIDKIAAAIILQGYLDSRKKTNESIRGES